MIFKPQVPPQTTTAGGELSLNDLVIQEVARAEKERDDEFDALMFSRKEEIEKSSQQAFKEYDAGETLEF